MNKAAAFDFDGTLFETMRIEMDAFNSALSGMGLTLLDEAGVAYYIGMKMPDVVAGLLPEDPSRRQELSERILEEELLAIKRCGRLYEGIDAMLAALQSRGVTIYICSNGTKRYLEHACEHCGIENYFTDIRHAGNSGSKVQALKEIKSRYDIVTFAGDREEDVTSAKAAGCISIACVYGYGGGKDFGAEYIARDIKGLHNIIDKALNLIEN